MSGQATRLRSLARASAFLLTVSCGGSGAADPRGTGPADSVTGTWRIVAFHAPADADGSVPGPFGAHPRGYLVYDGTGHVFLQMQDATTADSLRSRSWREAPDSALRPLLRGFQAYFGTYAVDTMARLVTHRIEGEFLPRRGTVEVATPYRLVRDTLILGADSSERWVFVRVR